MTDTLEVVDQTPDLDAMPRADLPAIWDDYREQAQKLKATAETLTVSDVTQVSEMKLARATRLTLRQLRIAIEAKRKELKEESLRRGQQIDAAAKELKDFIEPLETRLLEQEQFAERKEAERIAALVQERTSALSQYQQIIPGVDLGALTDEQFTEMLDGARMVHEAKLEAIRKEEEARIAREKAEAEERERVRAENERLRKEAAEREAAIEAERQAAAKERQRVEQEARAEREKAEAALRAEREKAAREREAAEAEARKQRQEIEAKARAEREAAEAKAAQERAAREKLERQEEERRAKEEAARKEEAAAAKKAAAAPDKTKLAAYAARMESIELPTLTTEEGKLIVKQIEESCAKFVGWIKAKADAI